MVKNFGSKKFDKKAAAKEWQKKLWQMLTCIIANRQSTINSKTKQFQTIVLLVWPDHFFGKGRYHLQYKRPHQAITPCA